MNTSKSDPSVLSLCCQCAHVYVGDKVDGNSGKYVLRNDYRKSTITNDRKNSHGSKKGKNGSQRRDTVCRLTKGEDQCGFQISVYQSLYGYYIKSNIGDPYHKFHEARLHLRMPSKLVENKEVTIVNDIHSAKAQTGVAVNTNYVRSLRKGCLLYTSPSPRD